jgi:hypothetical protein
MTTSTLHTPAHLVSADQVRRAVTGAGSHFFDDGAMSFFSSRTARTGWSWSVTDENDDLVDHFVLVTSEQFVGAPELGVEDGPRRYTVRHFVVTDFGRHCERIDDHAGFQAFATGAAAHRAAERLVTELAAGVAR